MSERPKRVTKKERYTYSWYQPSQMDLPKVGRDLGDPEGYIGEEPEIAEDSASMMGIESNVRDSMVDEASLSGGSATSRSRGIYSPKYRSSGMKSSLMGKLHVGGNMRIRIGAIAGWSALAGAGGFALLTRAGPFPATQMAELGAVWGGIAAFLWIIIAKLSN